MVASTDSKVPSCRIAVIGGGQSAKAILFTMSERIANGCADWSGSEIVILEVGSEFGTGLAWSRRFALEQHQSSLALPAARVVYGDGQRRQLAGCVELLHGFGVSVELRSYAEVIAVSQIGAGYCLTLAGGERMTATAVILATGYGRMTEKTQGLRPWPAGELQQVAQCHPGARWLVLGGYLSAIDAVITLALSAGDFIRVNGGSLVYRARQPLRITVGSRNGGLPAVWGAEPSTLLDNGVVEQISALCRANQGFAPLEDMLAMLDSRLRDHSAPALAKANSPVKLRNYVSRARALRRARARDARETLRADLLAVATPGEPYCFERMRHCALQDVLFATLPVMSECFHLLSAEDYLVFQAEFRTLFFHLCMPMGLDSALRVLALMDAGILHVRRLGSDYSLSELSRDLWRLEKRTRTGVETSQFDQVVVANGAAIELHAQPDGLWKALTASSMVKATQRRFRQRNACIEVGGVDVDPKSCRVRAPKAGSSLYAMGPLLFGQFLDAQGIGHIARDARRILDDLERIYRGRRSATEGYYGYRDSPTIQ